MDRHSTRRGRRLLASGLATALAVGLGQVALSGPASGTEPTTGSPTASPATASSTADTLTRAAASDLARRGQKDVVVTSLTTETSQTVAHPDGTFTDSTNPRPVRTRVANRWVAVDNTLVREGNRIRPRASALPMSFSGGGSAALATLGSESRTLSFGWPGMQLPAPVLDGDRATYPEVLPGVDLVMTADTDTFSEVLVVKDRKAATNPALRSLRFSVAAPGLTLRSRAGGVQAVDAAGRPVFASAQPQMWDSSGPQTTAELAAKPTARATVAGRGASDRLMSAGAGSRSRPMTTRLSGGHLDVVPDRALLTGADTTFPVQIDPAWSGGKVAWAYVDKKYPTVSYYNSTGDARVGYESQEGTTKRSFFHMKSTGFHGAEVLSATFRLNETWSWSCTAREMQVWATNSITSKTTWNTQPTWAYKQSAKTFAYNWYPSGQASPCPNPSGGVEFDVKTQATNAAKGKWSYMAIGIRAASETDTYAFKRFQNNPTLSVTYDNLPTTPTSATTVPYTPCTGGSIGNTDISLSAVPQDKDGGTVIAEFRYGTTSTPTTVRSVSATAGKPAVLDLKRSLGPGKWYWEVRTVAKNANGQSRWSLPTATCSFTVDLTAPNPAAVTVTSPTFPDYSDNPDSVQGPAGRPAVFTITTPADAAYVRLAFDRDPIYRAPVTAGKAVVTMMPTRTGPSKLNVQLVDAAGNLSGINNSFDIFAGPVPSGTPYARGDLNSDGKPDILRWYQDSLVCDYLGSGAIGASTTTFSAGSGCAVTNTADLGAGSKAVDVGNWDGVLDDTETNDVVSLVGGKLRLFRGNGAGGFDTTAEEYLTDDDLLNPTVFDASAYTDVFGAGDWDEDGDPDLAARTADGRLWLLANDNGNISVPAGTRGDEIGLVWTNYTPFFPGDITNDGRADIMARLNSTGVMYVYPGRTTDIGLAPRITEGSGWNAFAQILAIDDWNLDGRSDIAGVATDGTLWFYPGQGRTAAPFLNSRTATGSGWTSNWLM
ncbi:FG-GAP-like repeat-containing protein [Phycicoccus sonneratiae]|uniref:VCBS repeat-containing protein n=1 Tax=Phycicoccus sonneratiae TaxID=2807628 RepID=A0ABS2CH10_9MICO|nr:FG-GAP-like repeat-containing protein [Phycicoccus sonneraticus]MBM6399158.1 VCBS repeat-containing protein [Phycicoccus sonneraticus]